MKPFFSWFHSPINELAHFLHQLLHPLVTVAGRSTTFENSADFIRQLNIYSTSSTARFHAKTMCATFKLINFYSMVSHDHILDALGRFLTKHLPSNRLENLSIITIEELTELFLKNQFFYFENKIYRFRQGYPQNCLDFIQTLSHIYLLEWQSCLLTNPLMKDEFYGRFD